MTIAPDTWVVKLGSRPAWDNEKPSKDQPARPAPPQNLRVCPRCALREDQPRVKRCPHAHCPIRKMSREKPA